MRSKEMYETMKTFSNRCIYLDEKDNQWKHINGDLFKIGTDFDIKFFDPQNTLYNIAYIGLTLVKIG